MLKVLTSVLFFQGIVWCQLGSGTITGVVRDQSQLPIPNAAVKIVNTKTGVASKAVTNDVGAYRVTSILPGDYQIEASASGFDSIVQKGIALSTGQTLAVDLTLQVGGQRQTVTVEASAGLTETQSSSLAHVVD